MRRGAAVHGEQAALDRELRRSRSRQEARGASPIFRICRIATAHPSRSGASSATPIREVRAQPPVQVHLVADLVLRWACSQLSSRARPGRRSSLQPGAEGLRRSCAARRRHSTAPSAEILREALASARSSRKSDIAVLNIDRVIKIVRAAQTPTRRRPTSWPSGWAGSAGSWSAPAGRARKSTPRTRAAVHDARLGKHRRSSTCASAASRPRAREARSRKCRELWTLTDLEGLLADGAS